MHKQVSSDLLDGLAKETKTLEIGAGTLNHLCYEPNVSAYDIVEPFTALYETSPNLNRVGVVFNDVSEIPLSSSYDRIITIATLEHVCNLPELVARVGKLLSDSGVFRVAIPSEGTMLWNLGWKLTTGLEFRIKHGFDYGLVMKHEHVNTAKEIECVLRYFFKQIHSKFFGLSKSLSLYQYYECSDVNIVNFLNYSRKK